MVIHNVQTVANDFQSFSSANAWNPRAINTAHVNKIAVGLRRDGEGTHGKVSGVIEMEAFDLGKMRKFIAQACPTGDCSNLSLEYVIGCGNKVAGRAMLDSHSAAAFVGQHRVAASQQLQEKEDDCPPALYTFNHATFVIHAQQAGSAGHLALQNAILFAGERENTVASTVLVVNFKMRFAGLQRIYNNNFPNGKNVKGFAKNWKLLKKQYQDSADLSAGYVSSIAKLMLKSEPLATNIKIMITQTTGPSGASYSPPTNCAPFNNIGNPWISDDTVNKIVEAINRCEILVKNFNQIVIMKIAQAICLACAQADLKIADKDVKKQLKGFVKNAGVAFVVRATSVIYNKVKKLDDLPPALRAQVVAAFTAVFDINAHKKARKEQVCCALTLSHTRSLTHTCMRCSFCILISSHYLFLQKLNGDVSVFDFPNRTTLTAHRGLNVPVMQNFTMKRNIGEHSTHTRTHSTHTRTRMCSIAVLI